MHGARGLKVEFGAEGGPRAAEAWVRSIQLALLAFQHQAKRKYLKTSMLPFPLCVLLVFVTLSTYHSYAAYFDTGADQGFDSSEPIGVPPR